MDAGAADRSPLIREFDGGALYGALDAKRQAEGLSWAGAAAAIWNMAPALNAARDARGLANHPISPATLHNLGKRGFASCQHALFFLRWLDRTPESFLSGAALGDGEPLPACGPGRRPRWDLKALHAGLNEHRETRAPSGSSARQRTSSTWHAGEAEGRYRRASRSLIRSSSSLTSTAPA